MNTERWIQACQSVFSNGTSALSQLSGLICKTLDVDYGDIMEFVEDLRHITGAVHGFVQQKEQTIFPLSKTLCIG